MKKWAHIHETNRPVTCIIIHAICLLPPGTHDLCTTFLFDSRILPFNMCISNTPPAQHHPPTQPNGQFHFTFCILINIYLPCVCVFYYVHNGAYYLQQRSSAISSLSLFFASCKLSNVRQWRKKTSTTATAIKYIWFANLFLTLFRAANEPFSAAFLRF